MSTTKRLNPKEFQYIYSKVPRLCADLVVRTPQGIVLTLRALPTWHNQWHLPGGTTFYRETLEEAVHRIAREELGITVAIKELLGYAEYPSEEKERGFGWAVSVIFSCEMDPHHQTFTLDSDASRVETFSTLPENMVEEHKRFLEKVMGRNEEASVGAFEKIADLSLS